MDLEPDVLKFDTHLLGNNISECDFENGGRLNIPTDLPKNFLDQARLAAALCQYVYNCDDHRSKGTKYSIHPWKVLRIDALKNKSVAGVSLLQRIHMNGILGGIFSSKEKNMLNDIINRLDMIKEGDANGYMTRNRTGFGMMLFYNSNDSGITDIAFVTEGSNPFTQCNPFEAPPADSNCTRFQRFVNGFGDWFISNAGQGLLNLSPQHTLAVQIAHVIDKYCKSQKPEINLHFYGHSLGGGMAAACALATDREAITFDMAGLHFLRRRFYGYEQKLKKIRNLYVEGESLSTPIWTILGLEHNGIQYEIPNVNSLGSKEAHSLTLICDFLGCRPIN